MRTKANLKYLRIQPGYYPTTANPTRPHWILTEKIPKFTVSFGENFEISNVSVSFEISSGRREERRKKKARFFSRTIIRNRAMVKLRNSKETSKLSEQIEPAAPTKQSEPTEAAEARERMAEARESTESRETTEATEAIETMEATEATEAVETEVLPSPSNEEANPEPKKLQSEEKMNSEEEEIEDESEKEEDEEETEKDDESDKEEEEEEEKEEEDEEEASGEDLSGDEVENKDDEGDDEDDDEDDGEEPPQEEAPQTEQTPQEEGYEAMPSEAHVHCSAPCLVDDEYIPLQPEKFYFRPEQYRKTCKISTRCYVKQTVQDIKKIPEALEWFSSHPQFKHIFHMPVENNRKSQGVWMLLLHLACTDNERELWFVVNGVPIRYSMKEHALLSGLDCHDYPSNYGELKDKDVGDFKFVEKWFKRKKNITIADVKKKLSGMKGGVNKKKMAALYFLTNVLKAKSKVQGNIEPFFLKVVDDMELCEKFPWGRYTYDDCLDEVKKITKKFKGGIVKENDSWTFSGFILPIEAFAYESIPVLGRTFRIAVDAENDCPRLCKHMFKETYMKGYPLDDINEAIGSTRDIISILEPTSYEEALMERIIDRHCDDGIGFLDPLVELWRDHLIVQKKKIWWESLYEMDLAGRGITEGINEVPREASETGGSQHELMEAMKGLIKEAIEKMEKKMDDIASEIKAMVGDLDERLDVVECYVSEQRRNKAHDIGGASTSALSPTPATEKDESEADEEKDESEAAEEKDESEADEEKDESEAAEEMEEENEPEVRNEPPKKKQKTIAVEKNVRPKRKLRPASSKCSPYLVVEKKKKKRKAASKGGKPRKKR